MILVLTESGSIYRSINNGKTFDKMTEVFHRKAYIELEKNDKVRVVIKTGKVVELIQSTVNRNIVIFKGTEGINWLTKDCGGEIEAMNQGRKVEDFKFHPTESTWILAAAFSVCEDYGRKPCSINKEIYVSFDLESPESVPKERIVITHNPYGKGKQQTSKSILNAHLTVSDDFFKSKKIVMQGVNNFVIRNPYLYAEKLVNEATQIISLYVSPVNVTNYQFTKCQFPFENLNDIAYEILDTAHGQTFVLVNHWSKNSDYGNLYMSDSLGQRFSLSLKYVPKTDKDFFDFAKVEGLESVYLANHYKEDLFERGLASSGGKVKSEYRQKVTKITFNRGGIWTTVEAPEKDSEGRKIPCQDETCTLHLNIAALTDIGHLYTSKNALGLLVSTGNVGYKLANKNGEINTYVSRDAGKSWSELSKGSTIYDTGDHGSFLVFGSDQLSSNNIFFSTDEGQTVQSFKVPTKIEVYDVLTEPSNTASHFVAVGLTSDEQGMLISIDFSNFFPRMCQGSTQLEANDTDYESWSPHSAHSLTSCVLGRKQSITRKKPSAQCFNGENFERNLLVENCECVQEDWECDVGWYREGEGSCKKKGNSTELEFEVPAKCLVYYSVSQGYRKVTGDSCEGGVNLAPLKVPCPSNSFVGNVFSSTTLYIAFLIIAGFIVYNVYTGKINLPSFSFATAKKEDFYSKGQNMGAVGGKKSGTLFEDNDEDEED